MYACISAAFVEINVSQF